MSKPDTVYLEAKIENTESEGLKKGKVTGYTGNAVNLSDYGFDHPVVYNLEGMSIPSKIPYLHSHSRQEPLGHAENFTNNGRQTSGEVVYSYPSQLSKDIQQAVENGLPYQASFGLRFMRNAEDQLDMTFHKSGKVKVNNREFEGPLYVINRSQAFEVSATLFGRDSDTSISKLSEEELMIVKNAATETSEQTPTPPPSTPEVENTPPTPPTPPAPSSVTLSNLDLYKIMNFCKTDKEHELAEKGIEEGKSREDILNSIRLERYNNTNPPTPSPGNGAQLSFDNMVCRVAISLNADPEKMEKVYNKETVGRAYDQGTMSLKEMLTLCANATGGNFTGHSDIESVCNHIKATQVNNTEYSTVTFPNLLHRVSDLVIEERWEMGQPWVMGKLKERSKSNFLDSYGIRPSGGTMWRTLDADGKIQHGTAGAEKIYKQTLDTFAQIMTFKRQDIVNDDLGAIQESLEMMVEGAMMIPDFLFVNKLYGGQGSFLTTGKNNLVTGAGGTMGEAALRTGYNLVRDFNVPKGEKSIKTAFDTEWMLVTTRAGEEAAWELVRQERIVSNTAADTKQGSRNYWFGRLQLETFMNLDNSTYHASAHPLNWFLMPTNKNLCPYSMSFLNGRKRPFTENVILPADMLGFGVRGWWDMMIDEREEETVYLSLPNA